VEVKFKPIKNLHLSVHPPLGKVTVSSPEFFDLEKVKVYLITKIAWIKREQKKIAGQEREGEKSYITRESHQYLGKRYLLKLMDSQQNKIVLKQTTLEMHTHPDALVDLKREILYKWYRKELRLQISTLIKKYAEIMNLPIPEFGIRVMKNKWGSCTTEQKKLWFNIELAKKPISCIEYIVVHEMVHLLERNHNKDFVILMDKYLVGWRLQKKVLNELAL